MKLNPDRCPECDEQVRGTAERMTGISFLQEDEEGNYEYNGSTETFDDDQESVFDMRGDILLLCPNYHEWYARQDFDKDCG